MRHRSLPLFKILKRMNVYSNNAMAEMFTAALGGLPRYGAAGILRGGRASRGSAFN